jgi:hypothetical protein
VPESSAPRVGAGARETFLASLFFAAVLVATLFPVVAGSRSFFSYDLFYEHLPIWSEVQRDVRAGHSPFWLEGLYMGHPLGFTQEAPVFYPLTVPLLLTGAPVHRLADAFSLVHIWLAGLGGFLLVRFFTRTRVAPIFGGLAYMLSARTLQSVTWPNAVAMAALLPFLLLGIGLIAAERRRAGLLLTAASGGLALLAARPQSLLGAAPVLVAFAAAQLRGARDRRRFLVEMAFATGLAALLGAPSLLPSAQAFPETSRFAGLPVDARNVGALSVTELDQVFLPVDGLTRWPEAASYPGAVAAALFLVGIGLLWRRIPGFPRDVFLAMCAAALVGFVFAFGDAGPYRLISSWPLLRGFRAPVRFLSCLGVALAFGSALTLAALESTIRRGRAFAVGAVALLAADLGMHTMKAAATVPEATYRVRPRLAEYLLRIPSDPLGFPRRFWSLGAPIAGREFILAPNPALSDSERAGLVSNDELPKAAGQRFGLLSVEGAGPPLQRTEEVIGSRNLRIAQLAGASRLVIRDAGGLAEDRGAPPMPEARVLLTPEPFSRAILVARTIVVPPERVLGTLLSPAFDPSRTAIVEEGSPLSAPDLQDANAVALVERRPSNVTLLTRAPSESFLVLFDAYSEGWAVSVDGEPAGLLRADACFRGVRLAGGEHRVVFSYHPPGVRDGVLLGVLGIALLSVHARRRGLADRAEVRAS